MIDRLDFETDNGLGAAARLGVIVLQTDQTIEHEFARLLTAKDIALYHCLLYTSPSPRDGLLSRMPSSA